MCEMCVVLSPPHSQLHADKSKMKALTIYSCPSLGLYGGVGVLRISCCEVQAVSEHVSSSFGYPSARAIHVKPPHPNSYFIKCLHLCGFLRTGYFLVLIKKSHKVAWVILNAYVWLEV